jgi:hypothetical protein
MPMVVDPTIGGYSIWVTLQSEMRVANLQPPKNLFFFRITLLQFVKYIRSSGDLADAQFFIE